MSNADCCYQAGGRVVVTVNGKRWSVRSTVTVVPWNIERSAETNQDGSLFTTVKPMPFEADMNFSDSCGLTLDDLKNCKLDVTIDLIDVNRTYWFTQAVVVGRPSLNTQTGEISGLKIVSNSMQVQNR